MLCQAMEAPFGEAPYGPGACDDGFAEPPGICLDDPEGMDGPDLWGTLATSSLGDAAAGGAGGGLGEIYDLRGSLDVGYPENRTFLDDFGENRGENQEGGNWGVVG